MNLRVASLVGYFILVIALLGLVVNQSILATRYLSIAVQCVAVMLMIWARVTFGKRSFHVAANPTEGELVTTGPYALIRHPIYASILYFLWAGVSSHFSVVNLLLGALGTVGASIRIFAEERLIIHQYPQYADYAARTKRVVPFLI